MQILIALGSNLGSRESSIARATELIAERLGPIQQRSRLYETAAVLHPENPKPQPKFLNAVIEVDVPDDCVSRPENLLSTLLQIEVEMGRHRTPSMAKWSARVIDLDLLAVGEMVHNSHSLQLPHPSMHERPFVLEPLAEILPNWKHPLRKLTASEMVAALKSAKR